jgi:hypothetical protein
MPLILRAIITGFGYKIGAELGRYLVERVGLKKADKAKTEEEEADDLPREPEGEGNLDAEHPADGAEDESEAAPQRVVN